MKKASTSIILVIISLLIISCKPSPKQPKTNKEIIQKAYQALVDLETVEYDSEAEFQNINQLQLTKCKGNCYFDFRGVSTSSLLGKYLIDSDMHRFIWDDNSYLLIDNSRKSFIVGDIQYAKNNLFLNNSLVAAKNYFPILLSNDSLLNSLKVDIQDKEIKVEFEIFNYWIKPDGVFTFKDTIQNKKKYSYIIYKESFLPKSFTVFYGLNLQSYTKNSFQNYKMNEPKPDSIWNLRFYNKNYTQEHNNRKPLIKVGETAPNWILPTINGDTLALDKLKGKLVLLDFYFNKCGACIEALPKMNTLYEKYKGQNIKFLAINFADELNDIKNQLTITPINYTVLYNAKTSVAPIYHVYGAPTYLIIDKNGKVVYARSGTNVEEIEMAINENL